jgi:hypothetical protein
VEILGSGTGNGILDRGKGLHCDREGDINGSEPAARVQTTDKAGLNSSPEETNAIFISGGE